MKHYVRFYSPGTFISEEDLIELPSENVQLAIELSKTIDQRYGAKPYAFRFKTGKKESCLYHLGGTILTLQQVKDQNNPKNNILIQNMTVNCKDKIIINNNSWEHTSYLEPDDIVLQYDKEE